MLCLCANNQVFVHCSERWEVFWEEHFQCVGYAEFTQPHMTSA